MKQTPEEVLLINQIQDELNVLFGWALVAQGMALKEKALEILLQGIKDMKETKEKLNE